MKTASEIEIKWTLCVDIWSLNRGESTFIGTLRNPVVDFFSFSLQKWLIKLTLYSIICAPLCIYCTSVHIYCSM